MPISGPATGVFNSLPLGTQDDSGYELQCNIKGQEINASDAYGMVLVEGIWRGADWRLRFTGLEWNKTGLLAILQAYGGVTGGTSLGPTVANIGVRWTSLAAALVLTSILSNPPSTPQTLTATNAAIAPNSQTSFQITSKMRTMPLEMVLIPYVGSGSGSAVIPFSTT